MRYPPLNIPVPPMLAKAMGYKGEARFVSFQWTPYGDEADYSDGRLSGTGNWQAFLAYIQHPAVSPFLQEYDLGSSDSEARHALILDRDKLEIMIAPVKRAQAFLSEQWPPQPTIRTCTWGLQKHRCATKIIVAPEASWENKQGRRLQDGTSSSMEKGHSHHISSHVRPF